MDIARLKHKAASQETHCLVDNCLVREGGSETRPRARGIVARDVAPVHSEVGARSYGARVPSVARVATESALFVA
jgi:hypothetical protein